MVCRQEVKKMRRNGQRELVARQQNTAAFLIAQFQMSLKLAEGSYAVLELPFPIIPEFRRRVRPVTWRMRDKLFSVPIYRGKSVHFFIVDEKVKTLKYRVNAGTWPCATHMTEPAKCDWKWLFLGQGSLPLAAGSDPGRDLRAAISRLAHR